MENEKFQELILEHLARLTQEITDIKTSQSEINLRLGQIEARLDNVESRLNKMDSRLDRVENKLDVAISQTAELVEFRSEVNQKLDQLTDDVNFLKYKEFQNEADLYKLKKQVQITR